MYFLYLIEFIFIVIYAYNKSKSYYSLFENNILKNDDGFNLSDVSMAPTEIMNNKCDWMGGAYMISMGFDATDAYECVNAYPMIFDNHGHVHDHVCKNGRINYDAAGGVSNPMDNGFCTCDKSGYTKTFLYNVPVCVKNINMYT